MPVYGDLNMEILNELLFFDTFDVLAIFSVISSLLLTIAFNKSDLTTLSTLTYSIISFTVALSQLGEASEHGIGDYVYLILLLILIFFTVSTDYYVEKKVLGEEANWCGSFFVLFIQQILLEESFFSFFICLESISFCIFLIMSSCVREKSVESTIKYLILSSLSTCVILVSILLLYYYAGTFCMYEIAYELGFEITTDYGDYVTTLLILGLTAKLSIYPANTISGDVSDSVISHAFLMINIILKFTSFIIILELQDWLNSDSDLLSWINIISYIYGSLSALIETQVIRFLSLSATNQFGFLNLCANVELDIALQLMLLQMLIYFFAIYRMINVIEILQRFTKVTNISDLFHANSNPFLKWYLITIIFDLAGFPPFNVFFSKFVLLYYIFSFSNFVIFLCLLIINCIYYFYYLRLIKNILYDKNREFVYVELDREEMLNLEYEQNVVYILIYLFIFWI